MHFVIADDHPFTLNGIAKFVEDLGYVVLNQCQNGETAFYAIKKLKPDYAILDISMPKLDGLEILENIRLLGLPVKVIFITSHAELSIYYKACEYGIDGYLLKNYAEEELQACIETLNKGNKYLSNRLRSDLKEDKNLLKNTALQALSFAERKVFELVVQQKNSKEISSLLLLSEKTVEAHRTRIIEKLGLAKEKNALLKFALQFSK